MKKFVTLIAILVTIGACNNSTDSETSADSSNSMDTMDKAVIPPPIPVDTSSLKTDSAKVKRAMRK